MDPLRQWSKEELEQAFRDAGKPHYYPRHHFIPPIWAHLAIDIGLVAIVVGLSAIVVALVRVLGR